MQNDNKLRKRILTLAIVPSLVIGVFLLVSFALLYRDQIRSLEQEKFEMAEHIISVHAASGTAWQKPESLFHTLLAINTVRSVSLYDANKTVVASAGLPGIPAHQLDPARFENQPMHWQGKNISYNLIPIPGKYNEPAKHWLLVEMDQVAFDVLHQRGLLIMLVCVSLALATIGWCTSRLRTMILVPLRQLRSGLDGYLNGDVTQPIMVGKSTGFQGLADAIGELAKRQQCQQDDMQSDLEQYTQELRETLETVEIQNIELDMARKNALQSSRAKSEFLANASHELRTPLNGIIGFASLLLKTDLTNQQTDYLSTIEQSAQGLLTIINDILDISRLETDQLTLEYKSVPIYQIISEVLKIHAPSAHEKKLRLVTLVDPHVPQNLLGDPLRLKQVIGNLVSNAIKYSDQDNVIIRVNFMGETDNQIQLKFSISDSGIGLTQDQQNGLFESFSQIDTADNRIRSGTGLGLAIARGLVHRMHGEIGVDSEPGKGSTFWFTARLGLNHRELNTNKHVNSLGQARVLVYDNNTVGRSEVTHLMNSWGASYVEVEQFDDIRVQLDQQSSEAPLQLAILDAQVSKNVFDKHKLRACVEQLNNLYHLPVIVLALPSICRILAPVLDKLQAVVVARPVVHDQLHRTICNQLGVTAFASQEQSDYQPPSPRPDTPANILAVDDNPANLRLVSELLKGLGAKVQTASNGNTALKLGAQQTFDLVLMDIQMPVMDGIETTQRFREQEPDGQRTPIIALTAHAVDEQKTRLLLAGMDDYLSKPVSESDLRQIIDRWARRATVAPPAPVKEIAARLDRQQEIFDITNALALARNNADLAKDMFVMLLASLDETTNAIANAMTAGDMERLHEVVHKLYGGCCYCGVPALRKVTEELHTMLQNKNYGDVNNAVAQLMTRLVELQQWAYGQDMGDLFASAEDELMSSDNVPQ